MTSLKKIFVPPPSEKCTRCSQRVYQVEKIGPVNEVIFHKQCFRCCRCGQHLTLKTYFTNYTDLTDKEIYCQKDAPKVSAHGYDASAMGIRSALNVPGVVQHNLHIRGTGDAPRIGSDALHIRGALSAQSAYQKKYSTKYDKHHFPAYLVNKAKETLYKYQEDLEKQQREEEDRLMSEIQKENRAEVENMEKEFNQEWEKELEQMARQYEKKEKQNMSSDKFEKDKAELKKTLTVKMMKKKEAMSVRLQSKAQLKTATMVKKHSEEMLALLKSKQDEVKKELEEEIRTAVGDEIEQNPELIEEAMAAIELNTERPDPHAPRIRKRDLYIDPSVFVELDEDVFKVAESEQISFTELVRQLTEHCISDLQKARAIFRWITVKDLNVMEFDESLTNDSPLGLLKGIKTGTETYQTLFKRLCSYAGLICEEIKGHSKSVGYEPGMKIKEDTFLNSWNVVLIMGDWWPVQCNWGARHLVLNKDQSNRHSSEKKSDKIRYQYDEHYFLTDPDEFIQEFWANDPDWQLLEKPLTLEEFEAQPFVRSVFFHYNMEFADVMKAVLHTDNKGGSEVKINVPEELAEDIVFHYQLRFADRERRNDLEYKNIKIERFVFHAMSGTTALFSVHVPIPASYFLEIFAYKINESHKIGEDPNTPMSPFRLKCATKFKIVCEELTGKMHPLPNCATGEWGPNKAKRHFNMAPLTHQSGVINLDNDVEIRFQMPRALTFLCKLRLNSIEDALLEKFVTSSVVDSILTVRVSPPQPGQYGLDIYAKPDDASSNQPLAHACKYLLNCSRVNHPIELTPSEKTVMNGLTSLEKKTTPSKEPQKSSTLPSKLGPTPAFDEFNLKLNSHKDPIIDKIDKGGSVTVELGCSNSTTQLVGQLFCDPNEEWNNKVTLKEGSKKFKFTLNLPKEGIYRFTVLACKKDQPINKAIPVYIFNVVYSLDKKKGTLK
ncbi:hypothetical protein HELRODRAFT_192035 [Helobdella robusta]|uniref:LIM zinc-binding domain-containing protein n=1 Tax=Helobdella robusta TaxID=6412 RepID=T1FTJ0_HELRO|nr:hypothetical protein HELRODRAFT_192035 [Helobdella robusta]ESO03432.1 hypothetical protein HELRODRAFT_192035 [Helobdella robusta]